MGRAKWISRDPIGELGFGLLTDTDSDEEDGNCNNYCFVDNCPTTDIDAFGLYDIKWCCTLTGMQKANINGSIFRVGARASVVLGQVNANIAKISKLKKPYYDDVLKGLNELKKVLEGMVKIINSSSGLNVCTATMTGSGGKIYATYWNGGFWWSDKLTLDPGWFTKADRDSDLFHEISHSSGTDDGESGDSWMNAHNIEFLMTTDKDNWSIFHNAKILDDRKAAGKKDKPTSPRGPSK